MNIDLLQTKNATFVMDGFDRAVAVRYQTGEGGYPTVVAKGMKEDKDTMLRIASEMNIPIVQDFGITMKLYEEEGTVSENAWNEVIKVLVALVKNNLIQI